MLTPQVGRGIIHRRAGDGMTIQEAAKRLGKSESTVRRWIREEKLIATKVNGIWNIPDELVNDYLNEQSTGGQMEPVAYLKEQVAYLRQQIEEKDKQISELHQLLMAAETRSQQLLEDHRPFWRRWFKRKKLRGGEAHV